jgi:hypothetical protein
MDEREVMRDLGKHAGSYARGTHKPWWYVGEPRDRGDHAQTVKATLILGAPVLVVVAIGLLLALAGCTMPEPPLFRFEKTGATQQAFMRDRYDCAMQGRQNVSGAAFHEGTGTAYSTMAVNRGLFMSCMSLRGYRHDPRGPLVAPPETRMALVD